MSCVEEMQQMLKEYGWAPRVLSTLTYSNRIYLWLPPLSEESDFFFNHGITFVGWKKPRFELYRVEKKIFRNLDSFNTWIERSKEKSKSLKSKKSKNARKKIQKLQSGFEFQDEKTEYVEKPDLILVNEQIYYMCYLTDSEEMLSSSTNSKLLDTIIFNMDRFNER